LPDEFDVFLSHNSKDKPIVRQIKGELSGIGKTRLAVSTSRSTKWLLRKEALLPFRAGSGSMIAGW
jgi:hypothetical protein